MNSLRPSVFRCDVDGGFLDFESQTTYLAKVFDMSWTDERVESLKKLWLDGHSASQIAAELGHSITRNAVIGKVHRLGLSGRDKAAASPQPRNRIVASTKPVERLQSARPMPPVRGNTALALDTFVAPQRQLRSAEDVVVPISERVTIMELKESMCRWPLGDPSTPEFRFCGTKSGSGATYCGPHARIAYQPSQDRRRPAQKMARSA